MCLSTEAFALFLNIIGAALTTHAADTVTIHATQGDVRWHAVVNEWCTAAPYPDGYLPFLTTADKQHFSLR